MPWSNYFLTKYFFYQLTLVKSGCIGLGWSLDVAFSSWISRHHHHVLFEMKEIFLLVISEKTTPRVNLVHARSKEFELELRKKIE